MAGAKAAGGAPVGQARRASPKKASSSPRERGTRRKSPPPVTDAEPPADAGLLAKDAGPPSPNLRGGITEDSTLGPTPTGRCKATWKRRFKLPWREAGPPNHHDDKVDSDQ